MDPTKEAIEKIEALVRDSKDFSIEDVDGKKWTARKLERLLFEPKPAAVEVASLSGLVDFININIDKIPLEKTVLRIESYKKVELLSIVQGEKLERARYVEAGVDPELKTYPFEKYMEVEQFVIALRSMFEPSGDREKVISYVSRVKGGTSFDLADDGVSQVANTSKGASGALTGKETAPAIVKLRPFRTFRDIPQVESEFLFRMKLIDSESSTVGAALYEADGGRWRIEAIWAIREYLVLSLPNGPSVIA